MPRVFLVTGCSSGFGKNLVQEILNKGDFVAATARNTDALHFEGVTDHNYLAMRLDVSEEASINEAFSQALAKFGRIDGSASCPTCLKSS